MINEPYEKNSRDLFARGSEEAESDREFRIRTSVLKNWFDRFCDWFIDRLDYRAEPRISKRLDREGNSRWYAYDPETDESASFASEDEVRIWLERSKYKR